MASGQPIGGAGIFDFMAQIERTPFGERLFKARSHAKLSQPQLSKAVGMAQSTLGELEKKGNGSQKTTQLAQACGVRPEWLASGEGPMLVNTAPLRPEVQEIAAAFSQLSENQIAWAMKTIRVTLEVAPSVPEEADPQENEEVREYSSPIRRAM